MVKEPRPGRVKTRLGGDIGLVPAAWWFRHQTRRLLRRLEDPRWIMTIAVSPDREGLASRIWPAHIPRTPQGPGDLGARMGRLLARFQGPTCIVGADIPGIRRHHIAEGFRALGRHDTVFGPSLDGGYWLIGLRGQPKRTLFQDVRWSSCHALADTKANLRGLSIAEIAMLRDVDTVDDLVDQPC